MPAVRLTGWRNHDWLRVHRASMPSNWRSRSMTPPALVDDCCAAAGIARNCWTWRSPTYLIARTGGGFVYQPASAGGVAFAAVVGDGVGPGLRAVLRELPSVEPERVFGTRIEIIGEHAQRRVAIECVTQFCMGERAFGGAVFAKAVGLDARAAHDVIRGAGPPADFETETRGRVAAIHGLRGERGACGSVLGGDVDHAARGIAVQRGITAAYHLDLPRRTQVEVRALSLAVGHGRGYAVDIKPYAAQAEGRARAEAANGDLQILRVILAVIRDHAWYAHQGLGEIHEGLSGMDAVCVEGGLGERRIELRRGWRGDHDGRQTRHVALCGGRGAGERGAQRASAPPSRTPFHMLDHRTSLPTAAETLSTLLAKPHQQPTPSPVSQQSSYRKTSHRKEIVISIIDLRISPRRRGALRSDQNAELLRSELFSIEQLKRHAQTLAAQHRIDAHAGRDKLLPRLAENERI